MLRLGTLLFAFLSFPLLAQTTQQGGPSPDQMSKVDELFAVELAKQNYGSVTAAVLYNGQLVWAKSYGLADLEKKIPATVDTVYNMGSIGKQFTALMLLQLVERGRVRLSDPVEMYVPEFKQIQNRFSNSASITMIQLATHTSGLTGNDPPPPAGDRSEWGKLLISVFPQIGFDSEPGTRYQYSNVGYAILGLALERAAGQAYLEYLPSQIFAPLGMANTGFDLTPQMAAHSARGYGLRNGTPFVAGDPTQPQQRERAFLTPAGGLFTTIGDMAKFVAFEQGQGPESVLSRNAVLANLSNVSSANGSLAFGYGVGFSVNRIGNSVIAGHNGGTTLGYTSAAFMDRPAGTGMIFLRNALPDMTSSRAFSRQTSTFRC